MSHSYSKKSDGKRYRYYVCNNASKTGWKNCPHPSLPAAEIEGFILDEIRAIGLDDSLIEEVVLHTEQSIRNEIKAQKQQLSLLRKELAQADEATMAITLESIANAEKRLTALKKNNLCAQDVRDACRRFDPLWDVLSSEDQSRMLNTLLESVEFDSTTESININFAPGGVRKLSKQEVNR
jgi:site-specific DNA recombinase